MSKNSQLLEDAKLDIRSVLLTAPKGLPLQKFCRDYKEIIGRPLPFRELGYHSPEDFLKCIPEAVTITWLPEINGYLLTAVADEKTSHIEKLVSKQKISKQNNIHVSKRRLVQLSQVQQHLGIKFRNEQFPPYLPVPKKAQTVLPPRLRSRLVSKPFIPAAVKLEINQLIKEYTEGINHQNFLLAYRKKFGKELNYLNMGFLTLHECLGTVPGIQFCVVNDEERLFIPSENKKPIGKVSKLEITGSQFSAVNKEQNIKEKPLRKVPLLKTPSSQFSIVSGEQNVKEKPLVKVPVLEKSDFSSQLNNNSQKSRISSSVPDVPLPVSKHVKSPHHTQSRADVCDSVKLIDEIDSSGISDTMKGHFRQILKSNPSGIWAADFPRSYEELTGYKFNLSELGYFSLVELANALPDVFRRVRPEECKSDWILFDSSVPENPSLCPSEVRSDTTTSCAYVDEVIFNIRKILEGYPEGVYLDDFIHLYSLNCESPLVLADLGFDSVEKFLLRFAERVPLKFDYSNVRKKVRLGYCSAPVFVHPNNSQSRSSLGRVIPDDAVQPGLTYEWQTIPINCDEYIPVCFGTVINPSLMWIQLIGKDTSVELDDLMDKLDKFYARPVGNNYIMEDRHIVIGTIAAGVWCGDGCWHRISIIGIPLNTDYVDALFVDYGTREKVKKSDLRYLRKEFLVLPAQAIKARMAFVRPSNGDSWDSRVRDWLLNSYRNKVLMAEIIKSPLYPDTVSVWLCDSSTAEDLHLSMMLVEQGFATYCPKDNMETPIPNPSQYSQRSTYSGPQMNSLSSSAAINPADLAKALSTIMQIQASASIVSGNESLLEWILRSMNICGNDGSPVNLVVLQQLLSSGMDIATITQVLASTTNCFSQNGPMINNSRLSNNVACTPTFNANSFVQNKHATVMSSPNSAGFVNPTTLTSNVLGDNMVPQKDKIGLTKTPYDSFAHVEESKKCSPETLSKNYFIQPPRLPSGNRNEVRSTLSSCSTSCGSDSSEIFDEDDEEALEKLCNEYGLSTRRFVQRINLRDGYRFHTIVVNTIPYVSCGDISHLLWDNEDSDCLYRRLRVKEIAITTLTIHEVDYPEIFHQLRCFKVQGIKSSERKSTITLYALKNVIDILNIFGHPSPSIRDEICDEINKFNPSDDLWKNFSCLDISSEDNEKTTGSTDSDKFRRMCIFDLKATLEGLRFKRLKIMNGLSQARDVNNPVKEIKKIEAQYKIYEKRIKEIESICKSYDFNNLPT